MNVRKETLTQAFFPYRLHTPTGSINPAPEKAVEFYNFLRDTWLATHVETTEIPCVALRPVLAPKEGYEVVTEIFIPPLIKSE